MFEIMLVNDEFGQVLNEDGDLHNRGEPNFSPQFNSIDEAIIEKDRLLNKYIYAAVIITNLDSNESTQNYYNEEFGPKFREEKQQFYRWVHLPFYKRIFTKKPVFKYYDWKH